MCITDVCAGRGFLYTIVCSHLSPKMGNSNRHFYFFKGRKQEESLNPLQRCIKLDSPEASGSLACSLVSPKKNHGMPADVNSSIYIMSGSQVLSLLAPKNNIKKKNWTEWKSLHGVFQMKPGVWLPWAHECTELYRLPVKSSPCVPLMRKPTLPSLSAKCHPLPMHPSSSYVLGQACVNFISGLSAQTSLKKLLPGAKVICSFSPWKSQQPPLVHRHTLNQRSQLATCELDPDPRPVLFGSQSVGSDDIFSKYWIICQHWKIRSFHIKIAVFQLFLKTWKFWQHSAYIPTRLPWLELSGGWSLETGRCILPQATPLPSVSSHCVSKSVALYHWPLSVVLLREELMGQEDRSYTHFSFKSRETKDQEGVITKQKLNTYLEYSKLIIWINSFNPHSNSLRVGLWRLSCYCFLGFGLAAPHDFWDLSSPTRDRTQATGLPGNSLLSCYCWHRCYYHFKEWEKLR